MGMPISYYVDYFVKKILSPFLPDKLYLIIRGMIKCGYVFDLTNPKTFNEKLNWLKLHDRNRIYTTMVDKIAVKNMVASIIGEEYVVPLIKIYNTPSEINFDCLPSKCVIKSNQDSSGAIIWDFKQSNRNEIIKRLSKRIQNFYLISREWPYKDVKTRFFAEKFLDCEKDQEVLYDYKFWCFNGMPKYIYITCKSDYIFENFYDMEFNPVMIEHGSPRMSPEFEKPKDFELMKQLASKLSKDVPFVRVDFFYVKGKVYFSEYTFYDWGGLKPFKGDWDRILGECLDLPVAK